VVVRYCLLLAAPGIALGVAGAFLLTRLMQSLLFGVSSTDPFTYLLVSLLVVATAMAACYLPARRAARLDPMRSLR
jgi:ABC-type antimicrobial peptide transport system permease subunit